MAKIFAADTPILQGKELRWTTFGLALGIRKYVLLYFSAHWCPYCRSFTPLLRDFYEKHHEALDFEVLFLSLDNSEEDMRQYFIHDHGCWTAFPFEDAKLVFEEWKTAENIESIPTLVVLERDHRHPVTGVCVFRLLTKEGRDRVQEDPEGRNFPWCENPPAEVVSIAKKGGNRTGGLIIFASFAAFAALLLLLCAWRWRWMGTAAFVIY